jgi:hypothetical protein
MRQIVGIDEHPSAPTAKLAMDFAQEGMSQIEGQRGAFGIYFPKLANRRRVHGASSFGGPDGFFPVATAEIEPLSRPANRPNLGRRFARFERDVGRRRVSFARSGAIALEEIEITGPLRWHSA